MEPLPSDTLYIGGLDQRVTRRIIWDLCLQVIVNLVHFWLCMTIQLSFSKELCCVIICIRHSKSTYRFALQAGPVQRVHIPQEADGTHKGFAFCQFTSVESAVYAKQLFQDLVCLFGRPLRINFSHQGNRDT